MRGGFIYVRSKVDPSFENIAIRITDSAKDGAAYVYPAFDNLLSFSLADNCGSVERVMKIKIDEGREYTVEVVKIDTDTVLAACSVSVDPSKSTTSDFLYTVSNEQVTITHGISGERNVVIPNELEGYPVTAIGNYAFSGYGTNVTHMTLKLPDTLKTIGNYAFNKCWSLRELEFPASLTNIAANAFKDCRLLAVVEVPAGTSIASSAFSGAGVGTIRLHTMTGISGSSFTGTGYRVREIIFEEGIQTISNFSTGTQLLIESVYIPESVTSISGTFDRIRVCPACQTGHHRRRGVRDLRSENGSGQRIMGRRIRRVSERQGL